MKILYLWPSALLAAFFFQNSYITHNTHHNSYLTVLEAYYVYIFTYKIQQNGSKKKIKNKNKTKTKIFVPLTLGHLCQLQKFPTPVIGSLKQA